VRRIDQGMIALAVTLFGVGTASMAMEHEVGEAALFGSLLIGMAVCTRAVRTDVKVVKADVGRHDGRTERIERQILYAEHRKIGLIIRAFGPEDSGPHPLPDWTGPFN